VTAKIFSFLDDWLAKRAKPAPTDANDRGEMDQWQLDAGDECSVGDR
jgi:hypothetical protein